MALKETVTKEEVLKFGSVAKTLVARHNVTSPMRLVIIASTENPDSSHTVLFDFEEEPAQELAPKQPRRPVPIPPEPRIAVVKIPRGVNAKALEGFINQLANTIKGQVFVVPINFEVLLGNTAKEEVEKIHNQIHKMLDINPESDEPPGIAGK